MAYTLGKTIGNESVKEDLRIRIAAAVRRDVRLPHMLFTGGPGTGKSHFCRAVANEANYPLYDINSPLVKSLFTDILDQVELAESSSNTLVYQRCLIMLDECHELPNQFQQAMLKIQLEGVSYVDGIYHDLRQVTFGYCTTDPDRLIPPLRQRCQLRYNLRHYTIMEMAQILMALEVEDQGKLLEIPIPADVAHAIARRSRFVPRTGKQFLEGIYDEARSQTDTPEEALRSITPELVDKFFERNLITPEGLNSQDFDYLRTLDTSRKALGVRTIAAQLDVNDVEVQRNIEPFLRHLNLIQHTKGGREITPMGKAVLRKYDNSVFMREQLNDLLLS